MAEQGPLEHPQDSPLAPPVHAGPLPVAQAQSRWPTALGILAIIYGSINLLGAAWSIATTLLPGVPATQPAEPSLLLRGFEAVGQLINTGLAVLLLFGGIKLLGRRILGVRLLKTWAVLDIISTLAGLSVAAPGLSQAFQEMRQQPAGMPPGAAGIAVAFVISIMAVTLLVHIVPPVFALIWFSRRKIKEEVATWA